MFRELFLGVWVPSWEILPSHVILEDVFLGGIGSSQEETPPASEVLSQPLAQ